MIFMNITFVSLRLRKKYWNISHAFFSIFNFLENKEIWKDNIKGNTPKVTTFCESVECVGIHGICTRSERVDFVLYIFVFDIFISSSIELDL